MLACVVQSWFILVVYLFILVHLCFICVFARGQSAGDRSEGSSFEKAPPNGDAATEGSSSAADIVEGPNAATTANGTCEGHAATSTASGQGFEEEDEDGIASRLTTWMRWCSETVMIAVLLDIQGSGRDSDDCRRSVP